LEIIKITVLGEDSFDPPFIKFIQWVKKDVVAPTHVFEEFSSPPFS